MSIQFNPNSSATIDDSGTLSVQFSQTTKSSGTTVSGNQFELTGTLITFWGPKLTTMLTSPDAYKRVRTITSRNTPLTSSTSSSGTKTITSTIPENNGTNVTNGDKLLFARYDNLAIKDTTNKIEAKVPPCERSFVVAAPSNLRVAASSLPSSTTSTVPSSTASTTNEDDVLIINVSRSSIIGVKKVRLNFID